MVKYTTALLTLVIASPAYGQTCLGLPTFSAQPAHVNAAIDFADSATVYAGGIGAGSDKALFGTIGGGVVRYKNNNEQAKFGFLEFGYQIALGSLQLCPVAGGTFGAGPDDATAQIKVTSRTATVGGALAYEISSGSFAIVPNGGIRYNYFSDKIDERDIGSATETSSAVMADLGLSLILRRRVSLQPVLHVPLGGDNRETTFGVFVSIAFGW